MVSCCLIFCFYFYVKYSSLCANAAYECALLEMFHLGIVYSVSLAIFMGSVVYRVIFMLCILQVVNR